MVVAPWEGPGSNISSKSGLAHYRGCPFWFVPLWPYNQYMDTADKPQKKCYLPAVALWAQEPLPSYYFMEADIFPQKALVSTNQHFPTEKSFAEEIPQIFSCGCGSSSVGGVLVCLVIGSCPRIWTTLSASMSVVGIWGRPKSLWDFCFSLSFVISCSSFFLHVQVKQILCTGLFSYHFPLGQIIPVQIPVIWPTGLKQRKSLIIALPSTHMFVLQTCGLI